MKLKKLIIGEIVIVVVILLAAMVVIEGIPYLEASTQNAAVAMYQQKEYANGAITLRRGEEARTRFNYTTYDPAILVIELSFQSWEFAGNLTFYCNGKPFASIIAQADTPNVSLSVISVSGEDWVQTTTATTRSSGSTFTFGNEITFSSETQSGYAGTFTYRIAVRGSK